ncbi:VOC family protein [Haliangium ochraceum]|uniref:3-demethylubiquinone-9 3-methyltransferase n=1 Tax=Haliangium ochraceum (strain DSM 14365 / JCM 11303 / SMP-2) TaxID=502025 RepID=D0LZ11_HALO1|nr:VOC family protein [Haliangium ochraceum]ACY14481.1 3-demethylubiquinone-9 3-methyltransferase [Haliangium ochraceum DSM 14365]
MAIKSAIPYLFPHGRADEALAHYTKVLGARVESIMRFGEGMEDCPEEMRQRVMHAELRLGDSQVYLSDGTKDMPPPEHHSVVVTLDMDDLDEMRRCFAGLAEGGSVRQEVHKAFFGAYLGMVVDTFGIQWTLYCEPKPA